MSKATHFAQVIHKNCGGDIIFVADCHGKMVIVCKWCKHIWIPTDEMTMTMKMPDDMETFDTAEEAKESL